MALAHAEKKFQTGWQLRKIKKRSKIKDEIGKFRNGDFYFIIL